MLIDNTLFGERDKIKIAMERLKQFEPPEGYYLAFSGGKDSIVLYKLAEMAKVKFDAHYNITTVDPPELVQFIKKNYPDVKRDRPEKSMWQLIIEKRMPPTRIARYCCAVLKEQGGTNRFVLTGVRREESIKRQSYEMIRYCKKNNKRILRPIYDWTTNDVWNFIKKYNIPYCSLYDEGYTRLGCVMCPMKGKKGMLKDAERYPKIKNAYIKTFKKMIDKRIEDGLETTFKNGLEVYDWWINGKQKINTEQKTLF